MDELDSVNIMINQYNDKGLKEGYWEHYCPDGNLMYKGNFINGIENGYWEEYNGGNIIEKQFYL
jgi:antitoxin component YwqK of YwqJK toxin-antitoxin module